MRTSQLPGVLTPILAQFDLELEAVEVIPAGKRQLLRVVVDGDGATGTGPLLDDLAEASKALSAALDSSDAVGKQPRTPLRSPPAGSGVRWSARRTGAATGVGWSRSPPATAPPSPDGSWSPTTRPRSSTSTEARRRWPSPTSTNALVQVELNRRAEGD